MQPIGNLLSCMQNDIAGKIFVERREVLTGQLIAWFFIYGRLDCTALYNNTNTSSQSP